MKNSGKIIHRVDYAQLFRETLDAASGKDGSGDLRMAYAETVADRIQKRMPRLDVDSLDLDALFECAVESMRPVRLEVETDGSGRVWFATAIDIPAMINRACENLDAQERQALSLQCMATAANDRPFEAEVGDTVLKGASLASVTPKKGKKHAAAKKLFAAALLATTTFLAPVQSAAEDILGTTPVFSSATAARYQKQLLRGQDDKVFARSAVLKKQMAKFAQMKDKPLTEQLKFVNSFWNGFRYRSDTQLYGKSDHWATPTEFLLKRGGDCEDFALVKYWTLRKLGVPAERMKVLVGLRVKEGMSHAVLSVTDDAGKVWILDNLSKNVVPEDEMYLKFVPQISVSETQRKNHFATERLIADMGHDPLKKTTAKTAPAATATAKAGPRM